MSLTHVTFSRCVSAFICFAGALAVSSAAAQNPTRSKARRMMSGTKRGVSSIRRYCRHIPAIIIRRRLLMST